MIDGHGSSQIAAKVVERSVVSHNGSLDAESQYVQFDDAAKQGLFLGPYPKLRYSVHGYVCWLNGAIPLDIGDPGVQKAERGTIAPCGLGCPLPSHVSP